MSLKPTPSEIEKHLKILEETPSRLAAATSSLSEARLSAPPLHAKGWSAVENLAHVRACADIWTYSIYAMLAEESPKLALLDERRWAKATGYARLRFRPSLRAFVLQREELLDVLQRLTLEAWARQADIDGRRHTVFSQARRMARHELEHCAQIEALFKGD